ncbi:DinB family protein [Streptomyces sp. ID05-26A]|nr:DinB family protein [Streptomyces sp. ID05-26A]
MAESRSDLLRWQFEMTWSLFEYHLDLLEPEDIGWEPGSAHVFTMRHNGTTWERDWPTPEQESAGVATIAWLTWHIGWWWTAAIDHVREQEPREVTWPGPEKAIGWLRRLKDEWLETVDGADLDAATTFPWPDGALTVAHTVAWVNAELMKNVAEIGQLRRLVRR